MKKAITLLLVLLFVLAAGSFAFAQPVARYDTYAAYTDGHGHLYIPGRAQAVGSEAADSVIAMNAYWLLYFSTDPSSGAQNLYGMELESFKSTLLADDVYTACFMDEDTVCFVPEAGRTDLMQMDLDSLTTEKIYSGFEAIDSLHMTVEGLIVGFADNAGAVLVSPEAGRVEPYNQVIPLLSLPLGKNEARLTKEGELYLISGFDYSPRLIDTEVTAMAVMEDALYYISSSGVSPRLMVFDASRQSSRAVLTPAVRMADQLAASAHSLFMLTADGRVCRVDTDKGTLSVFRNYSDLTGYDIPDGYEVERLRIEAMDGLLNVYAEIREAGAKPEFSFIEFESEVVDDPTTLWLLDSVRLSGEQTAWDYLKPAPQYAPLAIGSRGEAVRAIQQPLKDLGYYDYYVDGIFGPRTQTAVRLLQFDLDRPVTGVADAELQRIILGGGLDAYDPYLQLTRGNRGLRVQRMQERLRELGYLADAADGIFGPRTMKAVQRFQSDNGLAESGTATRETLRKLYSGAAETCRGYIDLYHGDTGWRVRELNNRLVALYYLEDNPGSRYTSQTASAVRMFQRTAGLRETGAATEQVLRVLFSSGAPEAPGYIVLKRGDENDRVARLQRRLRDLNYYSGRISGYYDRQTKEAVALFQKKVGLKATGVATVRTQQLLYAGDAPEYVKPTVIGVPEIEVDSYDYRRHGTYFISDDNTYNGYILFGWDTEGDVESYNVRVTDTLGNVYVDTDTMRTGTGVSIVTLEPDRLYTLKVTAYPADGSTKHITSAEISFARLDVEQEPEIGKVGNPEISIETVARIENGVQYLLPGTVTFSWYAEGDVDSYYVEIRDERDDIVVEATMKDLYASIRSDAMTAGEIYTIFVYAIPENGTIEDARVKFLRFALPEIELPEADPTPKPTPTPTPEPTVEPVETLAPTPEPTPEETPEPVPTAETPAQETQAPTPVPETVEGTEPTSSAPAADTTIEPSETGDTDQDVEPGTDDNPEAANETAPEDSEPGDNADQEDSEEVADAAKTGESPEDTSEPSAADAVEEEIPSDEEMSEVASVTPPQIILEPVTHQQDGVQYVSGDILSMSWYAEGEIEGYYVELSDSSGATLAAQAVTETTLSARTEALDPEMVYTLSVTAIPAGEGPENGITASVRFAIQDAESAPDSSDEPEDLTIPDSTSEDTQYGPGEQELPSAEEHDRVDNPAEQNEDIQNGSDQLSPRAEESDEEPGESESEQSADEAWGEPLVPAPPVEEAQAEPLVPEQPEEEAWQEPLEPEQPEEEAWQEPLEPEQPEEEAWQESDPVDSSPDPGLDSEAAEVDEWDDNETYAPIEEEDAIDVYEEEYSDWEDQEMQPQEDMDLLPPEESAEAGTDSEQVTAVQKRLVKLGWLKKKSYDSGSLDTATINAIAAFQEYCNSEYGMQLSIIDSSAPAIDWETEDLLMNGDYSNPEA